MFGVIREQGDSGCRETIRLVKLVWLSSAATLVLGPKGIQSKSLGAKVKNHIIFHKHTHTHTHTHIADSPFNKC